MTGDADHVHGAFLGGLDDLRAVGGDVAVGAGADGAHVVVDVEDLGAGVFAQVADDAAGGDPDAGGRIGVIV